MKYIVENCPSNIGTADFKRSTDKDGLDFKKSTMLISCCTFYGKECQDCPDCLIKRLIDECKSVINHPDWSSCHQNGKRYLANTILQDILEIKEVKDV